MPSRKYKIQTSHRADRMMLLHVEFLSRVSISAARRLIASFKKTESLIASNPLIFPFADDLDAPDMPLNTYRKCIVDNRYKMIFSVEETDVYIDAVIDCRQENAKMY